MKINSLVNVLDSVHYLKQRLKYRSFFENQIRYAEQIILSKTETLPEETLAIIQNEIRKIKPGLPVYATPWNQLTAEDLIGLVSPEIRTAFSQGNLVSDKPAAALNPLAAKEDNGSELPKQSHKGTSFESSPFKKISHPQKSHKDFSSFTLSPQKRYTKEALRQLLESLSADKYGTVLRVKGFVKGMDAGYILEFNVVDHTIDIVEKKESMDPTAYFIGEDLDEKSISALF